MIDIEIPSPKTVQENAKKYDAESLEYCAQWITNRMGVGILVSQTDQFTDARIQRVLYSPILSAKLQEIFSKEWTVRINATKLMIGFVVTLEPKL